MVSLEFNTIVTVTIPARVPIDIQCVAVEGKHFVRMRKSCTKICRLFNVSGKRSDSMSETDIIEQIAYLRNSKWFELLGPIACGSRNRYTKPVVLNKVITMASFVAIALPTIDQIQGHEAVVLLEKPGTSSVAIEATANNIEYIQKVCAYQISRSPTKRNIDDVEAESAGEDGDDPSSGDLNE